MSEIESFRTDVPFPFLQSTAVTDRLVHLIPDQLAREVPEHVLFAFPESEDPRDGFVEVTTKVFANAINRTSWYLESILGRAPEGAFPTIAYMGSSDLRYFLFMFGAIKAGYKMLYLSPRNSVAGHINVLEKVDCETFLVAKGARIDHITSARPMRTFVVSELSSFLDHALVPPYPYDKTFAEARSDPCLVLHTTGSTGLPKPITWKLDILSTYEAWRTIPAIDGYLPTTEVYQQARRIYNAMPLFHTSGLNIGITMSLVLGVTSVFGAANVMPHAAYADAIHRHGNVDASAGPPSIYEDLSTDVASVETLSRLQYILVCGAPLSQAVGDALSEHTRVISNFGATETACLPRLAPAIRDWSYFYWHPSHSGIELREAMDGLYELFLVKDEKLRNYQGVFSTFAHLDEYSMNDLYSRHPDPAKAFLYRWCSRADDVIVLSNGEKLAPALMEAGLRSSSLVRGAMVVGSGQFQPAALIDLDGPLPTSLWQREKIMRELLPAIEQANRHAPAHGKLDEHHLLFVEASKPMQYLGQGKIQRRESYKLYKSDIEMLYEDAGENLEAVTSSTEVVDFRNRAVLAAWLPELIRKIAPELPAVRNEDWLFEKGLDSLHVLRMVRKIKSLAKIGGFEQLAGSMQPRSVYANPSISKLVSFLHGHAQKDKICVMQDVSDSAYGSSLSEDSESDNEQNEERNLGYMQSLLDKYIQLLPTDGSNTRPLAPVSQRMTILLTGSTGSLGSYVLNQLLCDPTVERIVCLDRSPRAREIYGQNAQRRGFAETLPSRVEFHKADLSLVRLGLESHVYERIAATVTHVFHCQWPVNFNWTLPSFEPYIAGVRNLIDLAHSATHDAFVMFISSVAAVGGWRKGAVPEGPIWDLSASAPTGYGQSKLIAECLLDEATRASGVRSAICRVGIVAGPVEREEGLWNVHEYIPSVIVASAHLGVFPETFPSRDHVDWLPVDKLSAVLVEIMACRSEVPKVPLNNGLRRSGTDKDRRSDTFHVVNPQASSWSRDVVPNVLDEYPKGSVRPVPFEQWLARLKISAEDESANMARIPAIPLIDFYEGCLAGQDIGRSVLSSAAAETASATLRGLGPMKKAWLQRWMAQWQLAMGAE